MQYIQPQQKLNGLQSNLVHIFMDKCLGDPHFAQSTSAPMHSPTKLPQLKPYFSAYNMNMLLLLTSSFDFQRWQVYLLYCLAFMDICGLWLYRTTFSHVFLLHLTALHTSIILCVDLIQVAHDVDGLGNYLLLTHRHVAHLHPFSSYLCRQPCPNPPSWVLYHEFTISRDNCIRIASKVHPQM